jgi:hypothetical protein
MHLVTEITIRVEVPDKRHVRVVDIALADRSVMCQLTDTLKELMEDKSIFGKAEIRISRTVPK